MTTDTLRTMVEQLRNAVAQQDDILERLTGEGIVPGVVIRVGNCRRPIPTKHIREGSTVRLRYDGGTDRVKRIDDGEYLLERYGWTSANDVELAPDDTYRFCVVSVGGRLAEVEVPSGLHLTAGMTVRVLASTFQILDVASYDLPSGSIYTVEEVTPQGVVIAQPTGSALVNPGRSICVVGDRVVLDSSGRTVVTNLGPIQSPVAAPPSVFVPWDSIGGQAVAKETIGAAITRQLEKPHLLRAYGRKAIHGFVLYGPPGCGKTMIGKAVATQVAGMAGRGDSTGFRYIKGGELLNMYVGRTEGMIRELFAWAHEFEARNGYPAVLFFDEAEALMGIRGMGVSSDVSRTVVPAFLTELDGLEASNTIVIVATNRPDLLDPAIIRDGRLGRKVAVERPDEANSADIFRLHLSGVPLADGLDLETLAKAAAAELFDQRHTLYELVLQVGTMSFTLGNVSSGALVAGIVDRAVEIALSRDELTGDITGVCLTDIVDATTQAHRENLVVDWSADAARFAQQFMHDLVEVRRPVFSE